MARNLVTHVAQRLREFSFQQPIALACHEVFKRIPHMVFHQLCIDAIGKHEWQLLLEHQRTTRNSGHDGVAFFGVFG